MSGATNGRYKHSAECDAAWEVMDTIDWDAESTPAEKERRKRALRRFVMSRCEVCDDPALVFLREKISRTVVDAVIRDEKFMQDLLRKEQR